MTIEEFAARYNQEYDWCHEIVDTTFFETRPYISELFGGWFGKYKITPETCDYSTAQIFEDGVGTDSHYFELQIYSTKACHDMYFWIHPERDENCHKSKIIKNITEEADSIKSNLAEELSKINGKLKEIHELVELINKEKTERDPHKEHIQNVEQI